MYAKKVCWNRRPPPGCCTSMMLVHRPLTRSEAVRVHAALQETPNILGYTVRELLRLPDVWVAECEDCFAGLCFSVDLAHDWTEIAVLLVLPEFRGMGFGLTLFEAAWERAVSRRRHLYILSRNPQVIGWMTARGMTPTEKVWQAPLAVHWYMARYMASPYRNAEGFRKRKEIGACPPLLAGTKRFVG